MTQHHKPQAHDSIHDPIPLTFVEWMQQAHGVSNTGLPDGWLEYREAQRERIQRQIKFNTEHLPSWAPTSLDEQYWEYRSMLDEFPGEPESQVTKRENDNY